MTCSSIYKHKRGKDLAIMPIEIKGNVVTYVCFNYHSYRVSKDSRLRQFPLSNELETNVLDFDEWEEVNVRF